MRLHQGTRPMNDTRLHAIVLDLIERIEGLERSLSAVVAQQKSLSLEATRLIAEMGAKLDSTKDGSGAALAVLPGYEIPSGVE